MPLQTIMVVYDGSAEADAMLHLACDMVGGKRHIFVLYVLRVPTSLPLDPLPPYIDRPGNQALDHAELVAWSHGILVETVLAPARRPIEAIIDEAKAHQVDAIFVPRKAARHAWQRLLLSGTERALVRQAPCLVLFGHQASPAWQPAAQVEGPARELVAQAEAHS